MNNRIRIVGALAMVFIAGLVFAFLATRPDQYHTLERRAAKARMIEAIERQVGQLDPETKLEEGDWWDDTFIRFDDGSWITYRARCQKVDPEVFDLFIGRESDGSWYYSTYHFCVGMLALRDSAQMDRLDDFVSYYALERVDGASDQALLPTWPRSASRSES